MRKIVPIPLIVSSSKTTAFLRRKPRTATDYISADILTLQSSKCPNRPPTGGEPGAYDRSFTPSAANSVAAQNQTRSNGFDAGRGETPSPSMK